MSRVLVCSDRIGLADPVIASRAIASGFASVAPGGHQFAVVPLASSGPDLVAALSALGQETTLVTSGDPVDLGRRTRAAMDAGPGRLLVDLTPLAEATPDDIVGLLAGLGIDAATDDPGRLRGLGAAVDLLVILPGDQSAHRLLGLEGVAARLGYAAGRPVADVLAEDAELARRASDWGVEDAPGLGAAGGLPLVFAALGGRLLSGFAACVAAARLTETLSRCDLVVVGTDTFTIGNFGGPAVLGLAPLASERGIPCLALAASVDISVREVRRHGIEAVQSLAGGGTLDADAIREASARVARTWLA